MSTLQADQVAVIGDLAGHTHALQEILESLGVTFDGFDSPIGEQWRSVDIDWPARLHVIQLGDLIHRGPDSLGAVILADRLMQLGHWTQLVGNHEQIYIHRPIFSWPERIPEQAQAILKSWWHNGQMSVAASLSIGTNQWLVTHAGLTQGFWEHGLGSPRTEAELLGSLREAVQDAVIWTPGSMLTGTQNYNAGPIWAEAGNELYASWIDAAQKPPFHQLHGHSSAYDWEKNKWWSGKRIRRVSRRSEEHRHLEISVKGMKFIGIDPGHGIAPAPVHAPYLLADAKIALA